LHDIHADTWFTLPENDFGTFVLAAVNQIFNISEFTLAQLREEGNVFQKLTDILVLIAFAFKNISPDQINLFHRAPLVHVRNRNS
jgi:hypothetical protein